MNDPVRTIIHYHERTKHQPDRFAAHLGYFDWDNQPNPFRRYDGTRRIPLAHVVPTEAPWHDAIYDPAANTIRPVDRDAISQLFFDSLSLSAWKRVNERKWAVRCNPSSGNLHPVEAYLVAPPIPGCSENTSLFHYSPYDHALEERSRTINNLTEDVILVGLTTIYWRESWKYGERAFRYCQMDLGHAMGAVAVAAALLGWRTTMLHSVPDETMEGILGITEQSGTEAEHPECLLLLYPHNRSPTEPIDLDPSPQLTGKPNRLSLAHHDWPIIETAGDATRRIIAGHNPPPAQQETIRSHYGKISARRIIRQRRSALALDGRTGLDESIFYRMLAATLQNDGPLGATRFPAAVHLAIFVHRVEGLEPGLYMLIRNPSHENRLRAACDSRFTWEQPPKCPHNLQLYLLKAGDEREAAKLISCRQEIASDGAFALGMIADFSNQMITSGAWQYKPLHWESGIIGQALYLEAEAAGIRATGIGCFFDDTMHNRLGFKSNEFQSLYHFTVGTPVEDVRLQTEDAYAHLDETA